MDADGQHDPSFIPQFEEALKKYAFVSGNGFWNFEGIPTNKIASNAMLDDIFGDVWWKRKSFLSIYMFCTWGNKEKPWM